MKDSCRAIGILPFLGSVDSWSWQCLPHHLPRQPIQHQKTKEEFRVS